jgi:hypothetical protein
VNILAFFACLIFGTVLQPEPFRVPRRRESYITLFKKRDSALDACYMQPHVNDRNL